MAFRAHLALLVSLVCLAVAVPADFGSAQFLLPPADIGNGKNLRRVQPPPQQRRGGFLEMLFGPRLLRPPANQPPLFGGPQLLPPPAPAAPSEPPIATVEILPKEANARQILVLGDFVADGLAWGLDQSFAEEPKLAVIDRANPNSGLVRNDFYDWNAELLKILNTEKPDVVVVAIGANDRQQMRVGKDRVAPHSEAWETNYGQRVKGITDTLKVYGRPFFWVSAPPMRLAAAASDMAYLNDIYKPRVAEANGYFVDVWGGFTSEEGRYISSGPDVDGQLRALRSGDGINFTRAGRLKLAFYVEREIRRQTGLGAGAVDLLASVNQSSQIEIGPDGKKRLVGPVISLSDPLPGASDMLAGGPNAPPPKEGDTPRYLMVVKGETLPTVAGRADDFAWPPSARGAAAAPPEASPPVTPAALTPGQ
jgi:hypothetical protein